MANQPIQDNDEKWYGDQKIWFDRVMKELGELLEFYPELGRRVYSEVSKITAKLS